MSDLRLDDVLRVINSEPELPDAMPDEMWDFIKQSKENAQEVCRFLVRTTKANIREGVASLYFKWPEVGDE